MMRAFFTSVVAAAALAPSTALADTATAADASSPMSLTASAMIVLPQADADNVAGTSPGLRAAFGYRLTPIVTAVASFEYVFVSEKDFIDDDTSVTFYSVDLGARATLPRPGPRPFAELMLGRFTASVSDADFSESNSDLGIRLGAGLIYDLNAAMTASAQLSYTSVEIEGVDLDAVSLEAGLGWAF